MGCIVSSNVAPLTSNLVQGQNVDSSQLRNEQRKRVADWVAALDRVPEGEQEVNVVEATEGSQTSARDSYHSGQSAVTVINNEDPSARSPQALTTPKELEEEYWQENSTDAEKDSNDELSIGASEPDLSTTLKKSGRLRPCTIKSMTKLIRMFGTRRCQTIVGQNANYS
jgi:hypothetical protein